MAGKNPKRGGSSSSSKIPSHKLQDIKPKLPTLSQLVRYDPLQSSPVNSPNKTQSSQMVSLGKPVQSTSFARALTSSYDPFNKKVVPTTPAAPIKAKNNKKAVSPHHLLFSEKLFYIEFFHSRISNPLNLIKHYFPPHPTDGVQQHFLPLPPYKTVQFYQNILQHEGSVEFKSIYDKIGNKGLMFHCIDIIKFTHLQQCGDPWKTKSLPSHNYEYSYQDYMDAWWKILLIQFKDMTHSWFIQWHKEYNFIKPECQPPMWFLKWWSKHGSMAEIIPDTLWNTIPPNKHGDPPLSTYTLKQALLHFVKRYKCTEYNSRFPTILQFCAKYKIPWIVKWSYQIKDNILIRNFAVKWWDNYDRDIIIHFVYKEFPEIKQVEDKPSSSIPEFLKRKSPEELAEIYKLAAKECQAASASTSGNRKYPASSKGSTTEARPVSSQFPQDVPMPPNWHEDPLYQDSQDPRDGYYYDVDVEDLNID